MSRIVGYAKSIFDWHSRPKNVLVISFSSAKDKCQVSQFGKNRVISLFLVRLWQTSIMFYRHRNVSDLYSSGFVRRPRRLAKNTWLAIVGGVKEFRLHKLTLKLSIAINKGNGILIETFLISAMTAPRPCPKRWKLERSRNGKRNISRSPV